MRRFVVLALLAACSCHGAPAAADAPIDTPIDMSLGDPCLDSCDFSQQCVELFDSSCHAQFTCVKFTIDCTDNVCSTDCQTTYCPNPYQCMNRVTCGSESPHGFTCYSL